MTPRRSQRLKQKYRDGMPLERKEGDTTVMTNDLDDDFRLPTPDSVKSKKNSKKHKTPKKEKKNQNHQSLGYITPQTPTLSKTTVHESLEKVVKNLKVLAKEIIISSDENTVNLSTSGADLDVESQTPSSSKRRISVESSSESDSLIFTHNKTTKKRTKSKRRRPKRRTLLKKKLTPEEKLQIENQKINTSHPELKKVWNTVDNLSVSLLNQVEQPKDLNLTLLPFQKEGLSWLLQQENSSFKGGILADEMGMGKTIQIISLLIESKKRPNLIIAPTVALMQWISEIKTHTSSLTTFLYYGKERKKVEQIKNFDVILTSYNLVEAMFRKQRYGVKRNGILTKNKSILHSIEWERVILDEAHYIKDRSCSTSLAIIELKSQCKWSVSGTPLQNRIGELFSTIRFLKIEPFSYYYCKDCSCKSLNWNFPGNSKCVACGHMPMRHFCFWNREILKPIQSLGGLGEGKIAFEKLNKLLDLIMLRRTKTEKADDLKLPPRVVETRIDYFNDEEEDFYESLYKSSIRRFNTYVSEGTVLNNYGNIFELISKMRLAANHPDLILKRLVNNENKNKEGLNKMIDNTTSNVLICVICNEEAEDPIISKCKHIFCREDADQYLSSIQNTPKCPACFCPLTIDLIQPTIEIKNTENAFSKTSIVNRINHNKWRSSTKIEALVQELDDLRNRDNTIKSIVFSQFVNFLDLIQWRLNRAGFACCRLDGRMSAIQREQVIKTFMENYKFTVFLISLKAGGVALNLTEASHVFLCDPWWNPAVEDQAMDRIHRLGQHRPIKITRLIIENSIESRILQLQEKKKVLFESTIGKDTKALTKLTPEDLQFLFL